MNNSPNALDQLLLTVTPVLPVPKHGDPIAALDKSSHRFLIAEDGIWLDLVRPWLKVRAQISELVGVKMPVGRLTSHLELPYQIPSNLVRTFADTARQNCTVEQAAFITFNEHSQEFRLRPVAVISATGSAITYRCPLLEDGEEVVVDMHSHARHAAGFSAQDNADDAHMVKLSLVFGNCDQPNMTAALRLCALGKFIDLPFPEEFCK